MKAKLSRGNFPRRDININIGGSKSESNRLLVLQAQFPNIAISNLSPSDDTRVLLKGIKRVNGTVDVHHAGTAMRFLTAYFAAKPGSEILLTGSPRMQQRPIKILVDALRQLGAHIEYTNQEGFPPLKIKGSTLSKEKVKIQANVSSQYISALMLVAPRLPHGLEIVLEGKCTSVPYIEMSLSLLKKCGIVGSFKNNRIHIPAVKNIDDVKVEVESDWSSASYYYSLVALSDSSTITLGNFFSGSIQGDAELAKIYRPLGVHTTFNASGKTITLNKEKTGLPDSIMLDLANTPDLAQTVAVSCLGLGVGCRLHGLHTLKIKETDRLVALRNELEKLGGQVQIDDTSLLLEKPGALVSGQSIATYQDHRMAMAFAPLAVKTDLYINEAEVVSKSYPDFWNDLKKTGIGCDLSEIN